MELLRCSKCEEQKLPEDFPIRKERPRGRRSRCRECSTTARSRMKMAEYQATYRERLKKKNGIEFFRDRERRFNLKRYGITPEEYEAMIARQDGKCAICAKSNPCGRGKRFHVDHDHSTGRVRGLLCHGCNTGLGAFSDSAEQLRAALRYLIGQ